MREMKRVLLTYLMVMVFMALSNRIEAQVPPAFKYNGQLELDGAPQNGDFEMNFFILPVNDVRQEANALWNYTVNNVTVHEGAFSATLIRLQFEQLFIDNPLLYLGVKVRPKPAPGELPSEWIRMTSLQRLWSVPYALASAGGTRFMVKGETFEERGNTDVPLQIQDDNNTMYVDGDDIASRDGLHLQRHQDNGVTIHHDLLVVGESVMNQAAVVGNLEVGENLNVNGFTDFIQSVRAGGGLRVQNGLTTSGGASLTGGVSLSGDTIINGDVRVNNGNITLNSGTIRGFISIEEEFSVGINVRGIARRETNLGSSTNRFCSLTEQKMTIDAGQEVENYGCQVRIEGNLWVVRALNDSFLNFPLICRARCFSF